MEFRIQNAKYKIQNTNTDDKIHKERTEDCVRIQLGECRIYRFQNTDTAKAEYKYRMYNIDTECRIKIQNAESSIQNKSKEDRMRIRNTKHKI